MADYTYDNLRLENKENSTEDFWNLPSYFLFLPLLVAKTNGLQLHLIWQALVFFGTLALIAALSDFPLTFTARLFWKKNTAFPRLHGSSG
jgi:hypothetical protein